MDDKSLRLYSIVENLHRQRLGSKEEEDAIYGIWKKDYEPDGKSKAEMAREVGKPSGYITNKINGYEARKALHLPREYDDKVSTRDLGSVSGLESTTAKKVLEAKAEGTFDTRDLDRITPILREAPEEKHEEILEGLLESKSHIEEYEADVGEVAQDIAKNDPDVIVKIDKTPDQKRLEKFTDLWNEVRWWGPEKIKLIEDAKLRKKAVETIDDIGQHFLKLAQRMRKEEGQDKA